MSSTTIQQKMLRHSIHHTIAYMPLFHCKFYIGGNTPGTENHYNTLSIQPSKVQQTFQQIYTTACIKDEIFDAYDRNEPLEGNNQEYIFRVKS